ncbi:hypothetical protein [Xanthobacter autotrophicus]|uniref:hypothetical protein n=1 Tax=Xanthobacter autotrophicus TaxID=280 RepID=UPI003728B44D
MPFADMMNDFVTLVKADGTVAKENMSASVQNGKIFTMDTSIPIEPGDHFLRTLPNGLVEDFIIDDPNYYAEFGSIPASYQTKVHRSRQPAAQPQTVINNITNHVSGPNSRVNISSTDNSMNIVQELPILKVADIVTQIRPALASLPEHQRTAMEAPVVLLEDEIRSSQPDQSRMREALRSIKTIAEGAAGNLIASGIIGLVAPLLSGGSN